jgi:hypothetical protein
MTQVNIFYKLDKQDIIHTLFMEVELRYFGLQQVMQLKKLDLKLVKFE